MLMSALAVGGCGSADPSQQALDATASRLGRIHSGALTMKVAATLLDRPAEPVGFALSGPFQLAKAGALPVARLDYTRLAGGNRATVQVVANGQTAWIVTGGTSRALRPDQVEQLRAPASGSKGPVTGLHLKSWLKQPHVADIGGGVDRITGQPDAGVALADMLALSAGYGSALQTLGKDSIDVLRRSTRNARLEIITGHIDRLLRRLSLEVDFGPAAAGTLARALGQVTGPHLSVELAVDKVNQPVRVDAGFSPGPG
jgi:hypothetical protein